MQYSPDDATPSSDTRRKKNTGAPTSSGCGNNPDDAELTSLGGGKADDFSVESFRFSKTRVNTSDQHNMSHL